jgi:hypothetical protein
LVREQQFEGIETLLAYSKRVIIFINYLKVKNSCMRMDPSLNIVESEGLVDAYRTTGLQNV